MEGENTGFKDAPPLLPVVNEESASNAQNQNTDASVNSNIEGTFTHLSLSDSNPNLLLSQAVSSDTVSINLATIEIPAIYHSPTSPDHPGYTPSVQNPVLFSSYKIPNRRELSKSLPFGLLFTPVAPLDPAPPCLHKPPVSCYNCAASINRYCKVDLNTGAWTCIFCKAENCHRDEYGTSSSTALYPELVKFVVEYMDPSKQPFPIMGGLLDPIYIFVVDLSIPKPDIEKLKASIVKALQSIAKGTRIGLITLSNVVSIYHLNTPGISSCRVLPGICTVGVTIKSIGIVSPDSTALRQIIDYIEDYLVPVENAWESIGNVFEAISSLIPDGKKVSPNAKRALGAAMETAVAMLTQDIKKEMKPLFSRILTFMSGSANYGPGAIPDIGDTQTIEYHKAKAMSYFKEISLKAQEHDIGIDIFCIGLKQFHSNILQNLVLSNGGLVHMQKELFPEFSQNILMSLSRTCGRQGSFEIRCSSSIIITHIIGSAVSDRKRASEEETTSNNFFTMRMGGVQPRLCYTIHYELAEDIVEDFVYFQFIVNFINTQNQSMTRVITRKIPTTGNFTTFLSSVDQDVTSVLLAKSFVLKARKEENITKINEELDKTLHQIVEKCGTANVHKRVYKMPETLYKLPRSMFLTKRGPLLGVLIQHADDLDSLRCMFLNASLEDSKRIMEPKLYMAIDDPLQMYYEVPLENLAMQSDKVLLMDNQTDIFIWSGRETSSSEFDIKRENLLKFALELSKNRFPQPVIQQFKEGSSMARWFTCRLVPSHKDSPDEQIDAFPQLEELTKPQIAKLISKFFKTDDLSYNQYCRNVLRL